MLLFNLYISIVSRKISWSVLVLNYFFLAIFKEMYYYYVIAFSQGLELDWNPRHSAQEACTF